MSAPSSEPTALGDDLSAEQRTVLAVIYELWYAHQLQWPSFDYVERKLHRDDQMDMRQLLPTIAQRYIVYGLHSSGDAPLRLTAAGIACCDGSQGDVALFLRALRWCYEHERAFLPTSTTTLEEVRVSSAEFAVGLDRRWCRRVCHHSHKDLLAPHH